MPNPKGGYIEEKIEIKTVYDNLSQEIVRITVDKLQLRLYEHIKNVETRKEWIAPLGILLTLILVFVTAEFKSAFLNADVWKAFFLMFAILDSAWLIFTLYRLRKSKSIEQLIEAIKKCE